MGTSSSTGLGGSGSVPNYLVPAILTFFCCWPLAIVSIVYASQVNTKLQAGDVAGAEQASQNAKLWAIIAAASGLVPMAGGFLLSILGALAG